MLGTIFVTVLRSIAIPIVVILLLQNTFLGQQGAFLAVVLTLTITNIISVISKIIRILPNMVLLKGDKILKLIAGIVIEILSILGFWIYYFDHFK